YGLRLNQALQEAPDSMKLLNLRGKWDNDEYRDDWARYEDLLEDRKTDRKVKKRKREAHISFHEQLDDRLDGKSTGNATSDNDRELVNNDDTSFVTQTESTSSDNDCDDDNEGNNRDDNSNISLVAQTQTETTTTNNYDNSKKFVSSVAPRIEIVLGKDIIKMSAKETIRNDGNKWILCGIDLQEALTKWKQVKVRPRTDLAFYDIIDITPGSNSDFLRSLPDNAVHEIKQLIPSPTPNTNNEMKDYIIEFIKIDSLRQRISELEAEKTELEAKNTKLAKQVIEENAKREAENAELKARIAKLEQKQIQAITNEREASTKDISPLTESHSPEIEHNSTQSEETKFRHEPEHETSTTSLPQDIIDDDSVEILDFILPEAKVSILPVFHPEKALLETEINASSASQPKKDLSKAEVNVPFMPQPETKTLPRKPNNPTHDRAYFCNKILWRCSDLYKEFSSEKFDYYGILEGSLCPVCKKSHEEGKSVKGRYEAGESKIRCSTSSYFIICGKCEIEITA
ncbi:16072_t:CDS:2, partial [Racocetra fulgida]